MADLKNLELDEVMEWPLIAQLVVVLLLVAALQVAGYYFYLSPKEDQIVTLVEQEQELKSTVRVKANKAARLPQLKAQLESLSERYSFLLQQLPEQKELASMLASVNELGINHQLTFTRMNWGDKEQQEFLYRLPLDIELTGHYHDVGKFSQAIAQLPRIIYFENVDWNRSKEDSRTLNVKIRAYTYQYQMEVSDEN